MQSAISSMMILTKKTWWQRCQPSIRCILSSRGSTVSQQYQDPTTHHVSCPADAAEHCVQVVSATADPFCNKCNLREII